MYLRSRGLGRDYRVTFCVARVTLPPGSIKPNFVLWYQKHLAGVRREGSWKAYCRVEHKRLLRLRSHLVRGYAETTDARVDRILRLPNGACWKVLAYWREAA